MADGGYCDYPPGMDAHQMAQLANFGNRSGAGNFAGSSLSKAAAMGFYTEQFQNITSEEMEAAMSMAMHGTMTSSHDPSSMVSMDTTATTAASGLYEPAVNYAMKPEKGLPPTPPGSPDDPKDSHSASHSTLNQQLAKPVPMRRLSEKTVAQARASLSTASTSSSSSSSAPNLDAFSLEQNYFRTASASSPTLARALAAVSQTQKRPRSEKKNIPAEQKDDKYFERRKRNNNAAKKSRDARKAREDEIAIRASFLEKENAILRAQVATLREEANSLKQLLLQKRSRH